MKILDIGATKRGNDLRLQVRNRFSCEKRSEELRKSNANSPKFIKFLHLSLSFNVFQPQVMTWGGLRGAVGLALALSMRNLLIQQGKEYTANLMAPWLCDAARFGLRWV